MMCEGINFAELKDVSSFARIIRNAFPTDIVGMTIYGCPGIEEYIGRQIKLSPEISETVYVSVKRDSDLAAAAEFRRSREGLYISYVAVAEGFQRQGIASSILNWAVRAIKPLVSLREIYLDVFEFNQVAKNWYERLGFQSTARTAWFHLPRPATDGESQFYVSGIPQAEEAHQRFGFSQFRVQTAERIYDVGRLADKWFRVQQRECLEDKGFCGALKVVGPGREILLQVPIQEDEKPIFVGRKPILISRRMIADAATLKRNLKILGC